MTIITTMAIMIMAIKIPMVNQPLSEMKQNSSFINRSTYVIVVSVLVLVCRFRLILGKVEGF